MLPTVFQHGQPPISSQTRRIHRALTLLGGRPTASCSCPIGENEAVCPRVCAKVWPRPPTCRKSVITWSCPVSVHLCGAVPGQHNKTPEADYQAASGGGAVLAGRCQGLRNGKDKRASSSLPSSPPSKSTART